MQPLAETQKSGKAAFLIGLPKGMETLGDKK